MAVAPEGAALVEAKAVDGQYPTRGALQTAPAAAVPDLLAERDGAWGAIADPVLFERLDLKPGARITIGTAAFELRARLVSEPDKIANGIGFGPRLMMSQEALRASGLVQPGSLIRWSYRLSLPAGRDSDQDLSAAVADHRQGSPGGRLGRAHAAQRRSALHEQHPALLAIPHPRRPDRSPCRRRRVANAVTAFVDRKRNSVGILKSLGATGGTVIAIFLVQVMAIALIGIAIGLGIGAALLFGTAALAGSILPLPITPTLVPTDLAAAVLYGLLTALAFSILPLGTRARHLVSGLFRDRVAPDRRWPRARYIVAAAIVASRWRASRSPPPRTGASP
jgi:putative ABC transport system permease protein